MKVIKVFDIETANGRFELTISARSDGKGYIGEYYGTAPKLAKIIRPGAPVPQMKSIGSGKLANENLNDLIARCRAEIEKRDGKIQETVERKK